MKVDHYADLSALISRLIAEAEGQSLPLPSIKHCPRCWGEVSPGPVAGFDGFQCGKGPGYPLGCGWRGIEPEVFDLVDAARRSRDGLDALVAEIEKLEGDR